MMILCIFHRPVLNNCVDKPLGDLLIILVNTPLYILLYHFGIATDFVVIDFTIRSRSLGCFRMSEVSGIGLVEEDEELVQSSPWMALHIYIHTMKSISVLPIINVPPFRGNLR